MSCPTFEGQKILKVSYKSFKCFWVNIYILVSNRFTVRSSYLFSARKLLSDKRNKLHAFKLFNDKLICLLLQESTKNRYSVLKEKVTKSQMLLKYRQYTNQRLYHNQFKNICHFFRSLIEWWKLEKLNRQPIVIFYGKPKNLTEKKQQVVSTLRFLKKKGQS